MKKVRKNTKIAVIPNVAVCTPAMPHDYSFSIKSRITAEAAKHPKTAGM